VRPGAASETAVRTAIQRAAHQVLDDLPRILDDPVAVGLVPGSTENAIRNAATELQQPYSKLLRSIFVLRSRFTEDTLREAVQQGVRQYVLLGAGFDTFAYRPPPWAKSLRIFEVDHPVSQEFKRRRLADNGIVLPTNVRFCPVDFESISLESGLNAAGFDTKQPALFSWLGVTQYLSLDAVLATLRFVRGLARGTRIVVTIVLPDRAIPEQELWFVSLAAQRVAAVGEPWLSRFEPTEMAAHLSALGFSDCFHLDPAAAQTRYFGARRDGLGAATHEQLLVATV
jgi:methyltransferase (TIGR00027 family)